ncbi:MAG: lipid II flippase MurJ, partial [Candidatus Binatia bacterium]
DALSRVFSSTYFSLKDTWTPTKITLLRVGVKIFLAWVLIRPLSHVGLALAESLSLIVRAAFLFFLLPDRVKGEEGRRTIKSFGWTLTGSVVMGAVVHFAGEKLEGLCNLPVELIALVLFGVTSYGIIAFLFQREESRFVLYTLLRLRTKGLSTNL